MFKQIDWLLAAGLTMLVIGGVLVFSPFEAAPVWAIFLVGPLLWYLGFGVIFAGIAAHFYMPKSEPEHTVVMRLTHPVRRESPEGVLHEIPSMGGFIL
jgi:uncharacterized membrane protein